jgi:mono/diheme cytochrome c family protein
MGMAALSAPNSSPVTFNKDVLPVLQKNCQGCHRPGEVAPMSLLTYADARPWAKAMKAAVVTQKMPPWFADPQYGHFANDRRLSAADVSTLVSWADNGAPEGDAKDKPAPIKFNDGWNIKPDMIIEMPQEIQLPATGTINYKNILVKAHFTEDVWVEAAEMRPGNPQVVHHMRGVVRGPGSHWMEDAVPGVAYEAGDEEMNTNEEGEDLLGKFNPGLGAQSFNVGGSAKFVRKGSDFVFNIHYTAIGKPATDRSKIGLVFAKHPPTSHYITANVPTAYNLVIPAGDSNAEVVSEVTVQNEAKLVYVQPHMHLRGKDYELRLIYPTGESETVFKGKWDFNWQIGYDLAKPIVLPKGTRIVGISHFDNSANNRFNPDPQKEILWGPQNWDEMSAAFLGLVLDEKTNPRKLFVRSGPSLLKPVPGKAGPTLAALASTTAATTQGHVTFTKDVAPILQRSCQNCHRPNSIAPMALLTYEDARPWARSIRQNVVQRVMPPWHIDRNVGIHEFKNSVALSDADIATIAKWVDDGAPQGDPADMPPPRQFEDNDRWSIGQPDLIVRMPSDIVVAARAPDAWRNITVATGLTEDRFIQAFEVKPIKGHRVIHHAGGSLISPDGKTSFLEAYGIGKNGNTLDEGTGILIRAGSKVTFGLHLHAVKDDTTTNVAMAFKFYPKGYVPKHVAYTEEMGDVTDLDFPPNTDNVRTDGYQTVLKPMRILAFQPHMHTRGKAMCMEAIYPPEDGASGGAGRGDKIQTLSCVSNFQFNWHIVYEYANDAQPLLPAGTVLHIVSWHDNSANFKGNPDADNWIGYGQRTIDDMSHAWITYYHLSDEEFKQALAERKAAQEARAATR